LKGPPDVFLEVMHLPLDDFYIAMGPAEHDRAFDHTDDVPSHLTSILIARQSVIRRSLVQVNSKFRSHLIETLSQPLAKRGMRITERCAEIPDQAASLSIASPDDHLAHGIQTPKNPIKPLSPGLLARVVAIAGQAFFDPVQCPASFFHVVIDHRKTQVFLTFEMMKERAAGHLGSLDDFVHLGVMKPLQRKPPRRFTQNSIARLDCAWLLRRSHHDPPIKIQNTWYVSMLAISVSRDSDLSCAMSLAGLDRAHGRCCGNNLCCSTKLTSTPPRQQFGSRVPHNSSPACSQSNATMISLGARRIATDASFAVCIVHEFASTSVVWFRL